MRRAVAAAAILGAAITPGPAHADNEDVRYTTFTEVACRPDQDDEAEPPEGRLSYALLSLSSAHQLSTGRDVTIGLLDSGINPEHASLAGASIDDGVDLTGSDGGTHIDSFGSGTTYASVLAGSSDGAYPIRGIAPDSTIVPIKIIDRVPETMPQSYIDQTVRRLADGIDWAIDNNIDVAVTALALPQGSAELSDAVHRAADAGLVLVAPVGELGQDEEVPQDGEESRRYPAAYDTVIAVTAVDAAGGSPAGRLNSDRVDIAAPGQNVPVASNATATTTCVSSKSQPSSLYAAINTAGVAALVIASHPGESPAAITHRLEATAIRAQFDRPSTTGWGIVNPSGAIHFIDDGTAHGPASPDHGPVAEPAVEGRGQLRPDPDPQRATRPIVFTALAAGGALALGALLGAAGRRRR